MSQTVAFLTIALTTCAFTSAPPRYGVQSTAGAGEAEVLRAVDSFYRAFLANDIETVERMTADDYLQTDVNGKVQDKKAWLAGYYRPLADRIKSGQAKWEVFDRKVTAVRLYGNAAVLIGTTRLKLSPSTRVRELRFTQVWIKRGGGWQRAVFHNSWAD